MGACRQRSKDAEELCALVARSIQLRTVHTTESEYCGCSVWGVGDRRVDSDYNTISSAAGLLTHRSRALRLSMRKYTWLPRAATGLYTSRAALMDTSVFLACATFSSISTAVRLVSSRFSISSMSSRMSP